MKIVRIIARLNVGGPARHVVWLTKMLAPPEFDSTLITGTVPEGEEDMNYFAAENGVAPLYIPEMSRELSPKDVISLAKVFLALVREKPDILHTHTAKAGTIGRVAGFMYRWLLWRKIKLIHTYHGHVFHSYYGKRKTAVFLFIERSLARVTDRIIAISEQQRSEINGEFRVGRAGQFSVVRLGIDLTPFENADDRRDAFRRSVGAADDEILVGFVGRLTEIKNIPLLLEAAKIYADTRRDDTPRLRFLIIGDGHLRESLEKLTDELGVREIVTFLGNREDAGVFYAGLDIVALTSMNEGTPLSLIEAMASGRAFVSTKVGGVIDLLAPVTIRDNILYGERGLGVDTGDAAGFAAALLELSRDTELRESLAAAGAEFVRANYSKERLAEDISRLYREVADN